MVECIYLVLHLNACGSVSSKFFKSISHLVEASLLQHITQSSSRSIPIIMTIVILTCKILVFAVTLTLTLRPLGHNTVTDNAVIFLLVSCLKTVLFKNKSWIVFKCKQSAQNYISVVKHRWFLDDIEWWLYQAYEPDIISWIILNSSLHIIFLRKIFILHIE